MALTENNLFSPGEEYSSRPETIDYALAYFRRLTLSDIYGKDHPQPLEVQITRRQYNRWAYGSLPSAEKDAEMLTFAKQHGLSEIGMYGTALGGKGLSMKEYSTRELTQWMPTLAERQMILWLANAVKKGDGIPLMLEVGYGSGIVAKILGATQQIRVHGVDSEEKITDRYDPGIIPDIPGWVRLVKGDIWEEIKTRGPKFADDIKARRHTLLEIVKNSQPNFHQVETLVYSGQYGDPRSLNNEIAALQMLVHERVAGSPIDIVLCSLMATKRELTVPIRDGIYPRAIVYIKPVGYGSKAGAGDFDKKSEDADKLDRFYDWIDDMADSDESEDSFETEFDLQAEINLDTHISFNPGRNYKIVARWPSTYTNIHKDRRQLFTSLDSGSEVVIQLRKDVELTDAPLPDIEKFPFDTEIELCLANGGQLQSFQSGIKMAQEALFRLT